ncbi:MAG: DUF5689 domain-containing protein [Dysgonamonadaceae bacterium]|jgi:alpha/beta superfamily hydrolase|nr:DUF5689 domain-containing protein [Dysgonamonadaceae bacterium]
MKTLRNLLLLLTAVLFVVSCDEREFDMPPINMPTTPIKANTTIEALKAKYKGMALIEITDSIIIRGLVVANDISGNIYKQIVLQDSTAGISVAIDRNNIYGDFRIGQEVFIECVGLYYGEYGGNPQLGFKYLNNRNEWAIGQVAWEFFREKSHLNGFPQPDLVKSEVLTIEQLLTNSQSHIGKLVTVRDVYFEKGGIEPFAVPGANNSVQTESKILISAANPNNKLTARNSSAANFAHLIMPEGIGSVTGVLSIFNSTLQITFRDSLDCSPSRFSDGQGNGSKDMPWAIEYALNNQTDSKNGWIEGYIVGSVAPGIQATNPISKNGDILFNAPFTNNTVVLAASPDVRDWTKCVVVNLPTGSNIRNRVNLFDTPSNQGKVLKVKGTLEKYYGAAGLTISTGAASEFEFDENQITSGTGETSDSPLSVSVAKSKQGEVNQLWAKGYIVGCVRNGVSSVVSEADVIIGVTSGFDSQTNVLIADYPNETDYGNCIVVNLPAGTPLRSGVNLVNNPGNIGKILIVKGTLRSYFGLPGSRDNGGNDFILE